MKKINYIVIALLSFAVIVTVAKATTSAPQRIFTIGNEQIVRLIDNDNSNVCYVVENSQGDNIAISCVADIVKSK